MFLVAYDASDSADPTASSNSDEGAPAPPSSPPAARQGATRADPVAFGEEAVTPSWHVRVVGLLRGQDALDALDVNLDQIETAIEDPELVAVEVLVTAVGSTETTNVNRQSFSLTGEERVRYDALAIDDQPELLDASLGPGEQAAGLVAFLVSRGEGNLLLHFTPLTTPLESDRVYLAAEPGALVDGPGDQLPAVDVASGATPEQPADVGEWVAAGEIAVRVLTVLRGPDAESFIVNELDAGELEVPAGTEFVMLRVEAANMGDEPDFLRVNPRAFDVTGSPSATVDQQFTGPLLLDARLYPGGRATGWLTLLVATGETHLLVLQPGPDVEPRYLGLE